MTVMKKKGVYVGHGRILSLDTDDLEAMFSR